MSDESAAGEVSTHGEQADGGESDGDSSDTSVSDSQHGTATGDQSPATAGSDDAGASDGFSWLYLVGLVSFLVTAAAFAVDLWTGHDIRRSVLINALAAVVLVAWAGIDSYRDRASGVETIAGAIGTGLILVGVYLLAAGAVVAATSVVHDRLFVGIVMVAGGVPLVLGGFLVFPVDAVLGEDGTAEDDGETTPPREGEAEADVASEDAP